MDEKGTFLLSRGVCDVKDLQLGRAGEAELLLMKICTLPGRVTCLYRREVIWLLGLHTYPDISENGDFFSLFFEKYASKCSLLDSFLSVHMKARKRWTYDSIPFRACAVWFMTSSHSKTFVYVRPHENDKPAFTKTPLWGPFENPRF